MGNINSQLSGIGQFTNSAANYGIATRGIFVDNAYNYGTILSTANFSNNSVNSGVILSAATFGNAATNNGYLSSTALFNNTSVNNGSILISATFFGQSNNSSSINIATFRENSINDDTGKVTQATFRDTATNAGSAIFASFTDSTINNGVVITSAVFLSGSTNAFGATAFSAAFSGISVNEGTALSATFNLLSVNKGIVINNATFLDKSSNLATGYFLTTPIFSGFSTNEGFLLSGIFGGNSINTATISSAIFQSAATNKGTILNNATFINASTNSGNISGDAVFFGTSINTGNIKGLATFNEYSGSIGGIIEGTIITPEGDPYFNDTILIDGNFITNVQSSNMFVDSSFNNYSVTHVSPSAVTQTALTPFTINDWSAYFPPNAGANTAYLSLSTSFNSSLVGIGTAKTTMELWVYPTSFASTNSYYTILVGTPSSGAVNGRWTIALVSNASLASANVQFAWSTSTSTTVGVTTTSLGVLKNQWSHIAVVIDPTTPSTSNIDIYINGVKSAFSNNNLSSQTVMHSPVAIGGNQSTLNPFAGYMSNLRITKDQNLYTTNFTPSATSLTTTSQGASASNVLVLTLKDSTIPVRNRGRTVCPISVFGALELSPFNYINHYFVNTPALVGGSGYFNGSTTKLTVSATSQFLFNTDPLTIEAWVYPTLSIAQGTIIRIGNDKEAWLMLDSLRPRFDIWTSAGAFVTRLWPTAALSLNTWNHLALVREGIGTNQTKLYVNGALAAVNTFATNLSSNVNNRPVSIGYLVNSDSDVFAGYISGLRVTKGAAVYTQPFNLSSTVPLASSNTSLLLNFTNANIIDKSPRRIELLSQGNVKTVQDVVKYDTSSFYFDGTGDYITATTNMISAGVGNFTAEFWIYPLQYGTTTEGPQLLGTRPVNGARTGYSINLGNSSSGFRVLGGVLNTLAVVTTGNGPALSAWSHMAVVRNGTNLSIYKNGNLAGTSTIAATTDFSNTTLVIGRQYDSASLSLQEYRGYLSGIRFTKGIARYTTTFIPPTASFPAHR